MIRKNLRIHCEIVLPHILRAIMQRGTPNRRAWAWLCSGIAVAVIIASSSALAGVPTSPDVCMADKWSDEGNPQSLTCAANDVYIAESPDGSKMIEATVVSEDNCGPDGGFAVVDVIADIHFNSDRYDIGIYSALDGGDALSGTCGVDVLDPSDDPPVDDKDGDGCGDVEKGTFSDFAFQTLELRCEDRDGNGDPDFTFCLSWRGFNPGNICSDASDVSPGDPSKCFCRLVNFSPGG